MHRRGWRSAASWLVPGVLASSPATARRGEAPGRRLRTSDAGHEVGAPDGDLQRAGLDPERELTGVERDSGGGESRLRSLSAITGEAQARRVPPERAEAGVLPIVPQRAGGGVEDVAEVRVPVQRADR